MKKEEGDCHWEGDLRCVILFSSKASRLPLIHSSCSELLAVVVLERWISWKVGDYCDGGRLTGERIGLCCAKKGHEPYLCHEGLAQVSYHLQIGSNAYDGRKDCACQSEQPIYCPTQVCIPKPRQTVFGFGFYQRWRTFPSLADRGQV